tara:strand:- start:25948 stop:27333 length:1386 start_codon:yes stop_codon:yes gene_type:complete
MYMERLPEVRYHEGDLASYFWNPEVELMSPEATLALQEEKLRKQVQYLWDKSELYREKFENAGFSPSDFKGLQDLGNLPFTTKRELRKSQEESLPFGRHLAASLDKVIRVTTTAGTTGRPVVQAYTRNDVSRRNESLSRVLWNFGVRPGDKVFNGFALSMFNAGVPFCTAVENLGAIDVPAGAERRADGFLRLARDVGMDVLIATPSFVRYLGEKCQEVLGFPATDLNVRVICGGGEPGFDLPGVREEIMAAWGTEHVYDLASMSDAHPNSFANCRFRGGKHHVTPDLVLVQLVDPQSGEPIEVRDGVVGEYIFTHLDREACPLLRYRTGDIVQINAKPCECSRPTPRFDIVGRADDMLIIRGMNVFPSAIQTVVGEFTPRASGILQIVLKAPGPSVEPPLKLRVESGQGSSDINQKQLSAEIEAAIHAKLNVRSEVEIVTYGALQRTESKAKLIVIEGHA